MPYHLAFLRQPAEGGNQQWTTFARNGKPYASRTGARLALAAQKRALLAEGWHVANGCDYPDSWALNTTPDDRGTRLIAEVQEIAPTSPHTPPAGSVARAMLDALDALEAEYTRAVQAAEADPDQWASQRRLIEQWTQQRQGIRSAIACARAAYADHRR